MGRRNLFASLLMPCLLAIGFLGITSVAVAPAANAASAWPAILKPGASAGSESARNSVIAIKHRRRRRGQRLYLPIAPSYLAYDYPYYYSRGFYPKHIGRGYVYYGYPYLSRKRYRRRCAYWRRRCLARQRHHRRHRHQRRACRCR